VPLAVSGPKKTTAGGALLVNEVLGQGWRYGLSG